MTELPKFVGMTRTQIDAEYEYGYFSDAFDKDLLHLNNRLVELDNKQLVTVLEWARNTYAYYHFELSSLFYDACKMACVRLLNG